MSLERGNTIRSFKSIKEPKEHFHKVSLKLAEEENVDNKFAFYERKVGEIFENNFDVFNGFYTIKTPYKKFERPVEVKEKKKADPLQGKLNVDCTLNLLRKALHHDEGMNLIHFNKKPSVFINRKSCEAITNNSNTTLNQILFSCNNSKFNSGINLHNATKYSSGPNLNFDNETTHPQLKTKVSEQMNTISSLMSFESKETEENLNLNINANPTRSSKFYKLKIKSEAEPNKLKAKEHLPKIATSYKSTEDSKSHFKYKSTKTNSTSYNFLNNTTKSLSTLSPYRLNTHNKSPFVSKALSNKSYHRNVMNTLLTTFTEEEETLVKMNKEIEHLQQPTFHINPDNKYNKDISDVTRSINLIQRKDKVLIYNRRGKDVVQVEKEITHNLDFLMKDFMNREQKKKLKEVIQLNKTAKGLLELKINKFKEKYGK